MFADVREVHWKDYLFVAWKRRWLVLTVTLVVVVSSLIFLAARTPLFTASAQVLIESGQQVFGNQMVYTYRDPSYIETQIRLMQTDDFIQKVVDELNLKSSQSSLAEGDAPGDLYAGESFHPLISSVRMVTDFFKGKDNPSGAPSAEKQQDRTSDDSSEKGARYTVGQVAAGIKIKLIPKTEILDISSTTTDPREATLIANTMAKVFLRDGLNRRLASLQQAVGWLQNQLKEEQVGLDKSRIELYEFMNKYGILTIDEKRNTKLDEELKLLEEKVRSAKEATSTLELKYQQVQQLANSPQLIDTIPEAMTNKVFNDLRNTEINLDQEIIKLSATYGTNHPKIQALEKQLKNIREAKSQEIKKIINALKVQYNTAVMTEKSIQQGRDNLYNELEDLKKKTVRYFTLKREVESNEKLYDLVLNRMKETSLTEEFTKSPNASIIQRAVVPKAPSSPDLHRGVPLSLLLALALGIGLAFLLEYLDNTFSKPDQIEQVLGQTFLGAVPNLSTNGKSAPADVRPLVAMDEAKSSGAEAYRALRTNLLLSSADVTPQLLLVTSPGKSEGKSLTVANLAIVMAQAGSRVLIIDCDLRKPKMHKVFKLDRDPGLANLLVGTKVDPQLYVQKTLQKNLDVITCGPIPPNPSELLGSKRMHALLESLRQSYERILIDSPPLMAATDAAVLTPVVDGTVVVVRAGETRRQVAQRAVKQLRDVNARICGVVLNEIVVGRDGYYYYDYYYQYGGYYGEEEGHEAKNGWMRKIRKNRKNVVDSDTI